LIELGNINLSNQSTA